MIVAPERRPGAACGPARRARSRRARRAARRAATAGPAGDEQASAVRRRWPADSLRTGTSASRSPTPSRSIAASISSSDAPTVAPQNRTFSPTVRSGRARSGGRADRRAADLLRWWRGRTRGRARRRGRPARVRRRAAAASSCPRRSARAAARSRPASTVERRPGERRERAEHRHDVVERDDGCGCCGSGLIESPPRYGGEHRAREPPPVHPGGEVASSDVTEIDEAVRAPADGSPPRADGDAAISSAKLTRRGRVRKWDRPPPPHDWRWWVGNLGKALITLGLLMFGFVAYQLWGTGIETARAQRSLESDFEQLLATAPVIDTGLAVADPRGRSTRRRRGQPPGRRRRHR